MSNFPFKYFNPGHIYALSLRGKHIYVGETSNIKRRLREHVTGLYYNVHQRKWVYGGSKLTRDYSPISLIGLYRPWLDYNDIYNLIKQNSSFSELDKQLTSIRRDTERELTLHFMNIEGGNEVRGSQWTNKKNVSSDILDNFSNVRPVCKCNIPAEKLLLEDKKEKWVCGNHMAHHNNDFCLKPSSSGLLFSFDSEFSINLNLECDFNKLILPNV